MSAVDLAGRFQTEDLRAGQSAGTGLLCRLEQKEYVSSHRPAFQQKSGTAQRGGVAVVSAQMGGASGGEGQRVVVRTKDNAGLKLNIAVNYGGRAELVRAAKALAAQVKDGALEPEAIDEAAFEGQLYTAGLPDVDLLIRTSGELRTSNFLPWQLVYAEMVFDDCFWPDFDRTRYLKCLRAYAERDRRFGGRNEPAEAAPAKPTQPSETET